MGHYQGVLSAIVPSETDPMSLTATCTADEHAVYECLRRVRIHLSQEQLAERLQVDERTIRRWELRQTRPPAYVVPALQQMLNLWPEEPAAKTAAFEFIDLFAGIGGIRMGFERLGGRCVFSSEWNAYAQKTYTANFRDAHGIAGDITQISSIDIPRHDLLLAGFPCQPFSIAGVSKKNALGRAHGFACETQGTLFFEIARILHDHRPQAFLLENVKNLKSHDKGNTFRVIRQTLEQELGYHIHVQIVDGAHFVPQHRERVLIAGFRDPVPFDWSALRLPPKSTWKLRGILHRTDGTEPYLHHDENRYFDHDTLRVQARYTLTEHLWQYLRDYAEKHRAKGNGFGFGLVRPDDTARTLSARYYKDGSEILVDQGADNRPRRLTPRECARLMGFPDTFRIPVSDTQAYKQFGNSVVMPVIENAARIIVPMLNIETTQATLPLSCSR